MYHADCGQELDALQRTADATDEGDQFFHIADDGHIHEYRFVQVHYTATEDEQPTKTDAHDDLQHHHHHHNSGGQARGMAGSGH